MKKFFKLLPMIVCALLLIVSTTACSPATLEDYFKETSMQDELQSIADSQSTDDIKVNYLVEENTVIFEYQLDTFVTDNDKTIISEMLDDNSYKENFENYVTTLRKETHVKTITLKLRYKDANGSVIAERQYDPE